TGHTLTVESKARGYDLTVINIPKTIDNDIVMTDHCPGYGSAARFVALATMGAGRDAESMRTAAPITIIEVMGRDAGWLAASAIL
ncbi:MAG TPA: 6-phosphofructokinase, partial [Dehalococcoidia bacterium]|nr:6-phosphofructokinase [Dehalococcoidia bacterium]